MSRILPPEALTAPTLYTSVSTNGGVHQSTERRHRNGTLDLRWSPRHSGRGCLLLRLRQPGELGARSSRSRDRGGPARAVRRVQPRVGADRAQVAEGQLARLLDSRLSWSSDSR